jgi:hypothetical protein
MILLDDKAMQAMQGKFRCQTIQTLQKNLTEKWMFTLFCPVTAGLVSGAGQEMVKFVSEIKFELQKSLQ